ncbi:MAG: hypothetical protein JXB45_08895 [Candidatus Krumholzibacteriota bacterium]|nr:hypothetical protein [Candidatus Krumholzibacteriota bacterium]
MVDKESVEKICSQIREDGEKEVESILAKAARTAQEIVAGAEEKGRAAAEKNIKEATAQGKTAQRRLLSSVNIEVKRAKLKAREEVISKVRGEVEKSLADIRQGESYPRIMVQLICEGVRALEGEEFIVYADRRDIGLLQDTVFPRVQKAMAEENRAVKKLKAEILDKQTLGGARVGVPGGKVIYDNLFEARMYRLRDQIRNIVFENVFYPEGSEDSGSA